MLNPPHNNKRPKKPERKAHRGFCGINRTTINETMAMLHQGKYKQAQKLNNIMSKVVIKNFIKFILVDLVF
jgi:hypothetical protein